MPESTNEKVVDLNRGAGDGEVKGKRAAAQDVAHFMQLAARKEQLKEAIVGSALIVAEHTLRHDKSVAALTDLNVEYQAYDVQFAQKYGIAGKYTLTPDGLIIEQS